MLERTASVRRLGVALWMVSSLALWGCGDSIASICEDVCDCEGCSDEELEECIEEGEELEERMEDMGCGDEFEDYVDCMADAFVCEDGDAEFEGNCDQMEGCLTVEYD